MFFCAVVKVTQRNCHANVNKPYYYTKAQYESNNDRKTQTKDVVYSLNVFYRRDQLTEIQHF